VLFRSWAVVTGALEIAAAIRLRRHISGEWLLALNGALSIVFGGLVLVAPVIGALAVVLLVGAYAFVSGLLLVALGFRLRGVARQSPERVYRRAACPWTRRFADCRVPIPSACPPTI